MNSTHDISDILLYRLVISDVINYVQKQSTLHFEFRKGKETMKKSASKVKHIIIKSVIKIVKLSGECSCLR